uniref:Uncharacterized protein n=1 Tax=Arundo donax TaxID=35708 RepID=A0A0A8Y3L3_ARUDO
MLNGSMRN